MGRRLLMGFLWLAWLVLPAVAHAELRVALVAGNDRGAAGRAKLWFAEQDALRLADTLTELGDFDRRGVQLLRGKSLGEFRAAYSELSQALQSARARGERTLLLIYYSGHADAHGLEFGNDFLGFQELRKLVQEAPADAKIAIVDACEAGLLTQVKGARALATIDFALTPDDGAQGVAYLASTAVGETAQESATLGGSFFTHHFEAALRGAADGDKDGRVTLNEAFQYTSAETVRRTIGTTEGAQHPTYEFKMAGRGDVVLTDLRAANARVRIPADARSSYLLRSGTHVLLEVRGSAHETLLALPAGHYEVERRGPDGRATGDLELGAGEIRALPALVPNRYELARAKGGPKPGLVFVGGGVGWFGLSGVGALPVASTGLREELGPVGVRLRLDGVFRTVTDGELHYDLRWLSSQLALLVPANTDAILIEVGPQLGYAYIQQRLDNQKMFSSGTLLVGVTGFVTVPIGPVRMGLDLSAGAAFFTLNHDKTTRPLGSAGLLMLYGF